MQNSSLITRINPQTAPRQSLWDGQSHGQRQPYT